MSNSATPRTAASQASPSFTTSQSSNSCPLSRWCHPTILFSLVPFSSCLKSFPASGSFPMSQFFTSGGQSIGASASALVLPKNIQDWFPLGWLVWFLWGPRALMSPLQHHNSKASILQCSTFFIVQLSHPYMTTGKTIALTGEGNGRPLQYSCLGNPMNSMKSGTYLHKIFQSKIVLKCHFLLWKVTAYIY